MHLYEHVCTCIAGGRTAQDGKARICLRGDSLHAVRHIYSISIVTREVMSKLTPHHITPHSSLFQSSSHHIQSLLTVLTSQSSLLTTHITYTTNHAPRTTQPLTHTTHHLPLTTLTVHHSSQVRRRSRFHDDCQRSAAVSYTHLTLPTKA